MRTIVTKGSVRSRSKQGFTLVELLLATVIMSIVMMGGGSLLVSYWRMHADFTKEESTMQEISLLARIFSQNALTQTSSQDPDISNGITFIDDAGVRSSISFDAGTHSVLYDPNLANAGDTMLLLNNSVVADFTASIVIFTNIGIVQMDVDIVEQELDRTNTYRFASKPRNQ